MALRNIVLEGNDVLRKKARPVEKFDDKLAQLLEDMAETMYEANGVGLAAPQVGILRRVFVIDTTEERNGLIEFINPEIVYQSEEIQEGQEGCLSSPGEYGIVSRPMKVKCEYYDRNGQKQEIEATELLARAICHENDHLNGQLFKDLATRMIDPEEEE